ncbi:hypothetical protein K4K48_004082 [Colletotrichum sp. SAR 10_66]|nr:hypothetical protein K4K48_004082 [Colletotrichum sp. SAR 10_66]
MGPHHPSQGQRSEPPPEEQQSAVAENARRVEENLAAPAPEAGSHDTSSPVTGLPMDRDFYPELAWGGRREGGGLMEAHDHLSEAGRLPAVLENLEQTTGDDDDDLGSGTDDDIDAEFEYYDPGNTLYLEPYDPCEPYGVEAYPWPNNNDIEPAIVGKNMCYAQEEGSLTRELTKLVVKIQDMLAGGETPGPQVLVCKVEEPSEGFPECVVVKICDPLGYNVDTNNDGTPWRETSRADIHVCCEAAALDFLDKSPLIGDKRLAPKYYGAFILNVPKINPTVGEGGYREVPVLVMEHIQGISMSAMCAVNDTGVLRPPTSPARWYSNGTHTLQMDEETRLEVLKIFLDGYVQQLFAGVEQRRIEPEHILIAPTEKYQPRVALIHYRDSLIDSKHKKPLKMYEDYEHPPHPFTRFSCQKLRALTGWFPSKWKEIDMDIWLIESFNDDKWGPYQPSKIIPDGAILEEMEKRGKIVKVKSERLGEEESK